MTRLLLCAAAFAASGCTAAIPMVGESHLRIDWRADFASAADEARRTDRPILLVVAAGDKGGRC